MKGSSLFHSAQGNGIVREYFAANFTKKANLLAYEKIYLVFVMKMC